MGRKREVLNALDELGIDYNELESGEVLFDHKNGHYWFHPDDSKPDYITFNQINECGFGSFQPDVFGMVNEINKSSPGVKVLMMGNDILINCDLYSGHHRLCSGDIRNALSRLEITGKLWEQMAEKLLKK